jgi:hypothetical protein
MSKEGAVNKGFRIASLTAISVLVLGLWAGSALQAQSKKLCCVAGDYEGFQIVYAKPNCPAPVKETFKMVIKQAAECGADVKGTITDPAGTVNFWTGTLSRSLRRGCCQLEGSFTTPSGNTVKFKGTICMASGKWQAKGTWEEIGSTDPCRGAGTWQITKI